MVILLVLLNYNFLIINNIIRGQGLEARGKGDYLIFKPLEKLNYIF
jgi:hypothetical protein